MPHKVKKTSFQTKHTIVVWTSSMIAKLGTASDSAVSKQLNIHQHSVTYKRRLLMIPAFHQSASGKKFRWTPKRLSKLGTQPDTELAKAWGLPRSTVRKRRVCRNIPAFTEDRLQPHRWTKTQLSILGQLSDAQIAKKIKRSVSIVRAKRLSLGIDATRQDGRGHPPRVWSTKEIKLLGTAPDSKVAAQLSLSTKVVRQERRRRSIVSFRDKLRTQRWSALILKRLGKEPDSAIAKDLGIDNATVREVRVARGIPSWQSNQLSHTV